VNTPFKKKTLAVKGGTPAMDPSRYEQRVRALEAFGHRGSATPNEHKAAEYLAGQLRQSGIEPTIEEFRGARSMASRFLVHVLLAAIASLVLVWTPIVTIVLAAAALVSLVWEQTKCVVWLSRPVTVHRSHNVCGRIPPAGPARHRILLSAHYDTQPSGFVWTINRPLMEWGFHSPLYLKSPMLPVAGLMAGQIALAVARLALGPIPLLTYLNDAVLVVYALLAMLFIQWAFGRPVPGAADNASGVAAVLELAEEWLRDPAADDVELAVLLTGCEECGLLGAAAWADRHRQEIASLPTLFLNIDAIGFGPPRFLGAEVPAAGPPLRFDPEMVALCAAAAAEAGRIDAGPHAIPGPSDGLAFLARGIRGVTIVGFRDGGVLPHYHTFQDTSQNMDFAAARAGVEFAQSICRKMAVIRDPK
jgi:hypothetical protein